MPRLSSLDPFAAPPDGAPPSDDPLTAEPVPAFAGARGGPAVAIEPRSSLDRSLADRDPFAPLDETAEYTAAGAVSLDDVLRRARRHGFLAGCLAGGAAVAAFVVVTWLLVGTAPVPMLEVRGEPRPPSERADGPAAGAALDGEGASGTQGATDAAAATVDAAPAPPAPPARRRRLPGVVAAAVAPPPPEGGVLGAAAPAEAAGAPDAAPADAAGVVAAAISGATASADASPAVAAPTEDPPEAAARPPSERDVMAALREHADAIDECVALAAGDEVGVRGRRFPLVVAIEPSGAVSGARVLDPDVEPTPVGSCLVALARELSFPAFDGEAVEVELPVRYGRSE